MGVDYNIIKSGSRGNAVIINNEIMIDCGVPFKDLKGYYKSLKLILLTHAHSDHFIKATVNRLSRERPLLRFGCCEWLAEHLVYCGVEKKNIDVYNFDNYFNYSLFKVKAIPLKHNIPNCGYKIHYPENKIIYATDTNTMSGIKAKDYNLYLVEANYCEKQIAERIKSNEESGRFSYEYEVIKNHLSVQKCDAWLAENINLSSEVIYLHQHKEKE